MLIEFCLLGGVFISAIARAGSRRKVPDFPPLKNPGSPTTTSPAPKVENEIREVGHEIAIEGLGLVGDVLTTAALEHMPVATKTGLAIKGVLKSTWAWVKGASSWIGAKLSALAAYVAGLNPATLGAVVIGFVVIKVTLIVLIR